MLARVGRFDPRQLFHFFIQCICPGVPINVQMMNTVLKVKLENGQSFSPAEVLAEMENKRSLEPNRVSGVRYR